VLLVATWALLSLTHWTPEGTHRFDVAPRSLTVSLGASVFYLHDLIWGTFPRLFPPGWSLEVEVQFYVLAPLLFALWATLRAGGERVVLMLLFLATGVNLSLLGWKTLGPLHIEYSLLHYFNYFWLGIALAFARPALTSRLAQVSAPAVTALGWLGLAGFVAVSAPGERRRSGSKRRGWRRLICVWRRSSPRPSMRVPDFAASAPRRGSASSAALAIRSISCICKSFR